MCMTLGMMVMTNAQVIFEENFENCTSMGPMPAGWTVYEDDLTTAIGFADWGDGWIAYEESSRGKIAVSISQTDEGDEDVTVMCDRWLITPKIAINSQDLKLSFKLGGKTNVPFTERVKVMISTTTTEKSAFSEVEEFDNVSAYEERNIDLSAYNGEEIYIAFVNCGNGFFVLLDDVKVALEPRPIMNLVETKIPYYVMKNCDTVVGGRIENKGGIAINSFDAYYKVNGTISEVSHFDGIEVKYDSVYDFVIEDSLNCGTIGNKNIEVFVRNVNGGEFGMIDEQRLCGEMIVYDEMHQYERTTLLEQFMVDTCTNGNDFEQNVQEAIADNEHVIEMTYYAGSSLDDMTVEEHEALMEFYNSAVFSPALMLDRTKFDFENKSVVFYPETTEDIEERINDANTMPSIVKLEMDKPIYDSINRKLWIKVKGEVMDAYEMEKLRLSVYLVEDSVLAMDGERYYRNVVRDVVTEVWGECLDEYNFEKQYEYNLSMNFDIHHCKIVAFVSNYSEDVNNRRVMNATQVEGYVNVSNEEIERVEECEVTLYPNPTKDWLKIKCDAKVLEVSIVNMIGERVYDEKNVDENEMIDLRGMNSGVYVVRIRIDKGAKSERLLVVK